MSEPVIYHGTPLTPRDALNAILPGRASCVSFFRPDDVEAVEAGCPFVMFRQRRILRMARGGEARGRVVHPRGLDALLRLAGATAIHAGSLGRDPGCAGCAIPAQRQPTARMAVRSIKGRAALAHGRTDRAAAAPLRAVRSRVSRLDGRGQGLPGWMRGVVSPNGRDRGDFRKSLAHPPHDARCAGRARVSLPQRGQHLARAERSSL